MQQIFAVVEKAGTMTLRLDAPFDTHCIQALLRGDLIAQRRFYFHFHGQVRRVCRRICTNLGLHSDSCEVTQEVWLRLLQDNCRRLRAYRPERGDFGPFLRMVAWQQATAVINTSASQRIRTLPLEQSGYNERRAANCAEAYERRQYVQCVVDEAGDVLTECDYVLLQDTALGETPARELAEVIGCNIEAIHKRRQRLRSKLAAAARRLALDEMAKICAARSHRLPAAI